MNATEVIQTALDNGMRVVNYINDGRNPNVKAKYLAEFFNFPMTPEKHVLIGEGESYEAAVLDALGYFQEYGWSLPSSEVSG